MDIEFKVSAKTARLIGRENISDVDGAIIELVKNGYDADADCVFVKYIIPYDTVPNEITLSEMKRYFSSYMNKMKNYYYIDGGKYILKKDISDEELEELISIILSVSQIYVIDNGCGMSEKILSSTWMNIGTDDKEINIYSKKKKRIKTGAKGIGRFALDKLSMNSIVYTKNENDNCLKWQVNWSQFDNVKFLNQVKAHISGTEIQFNDLVKKLLKEDYEKVKQYNWTTGTAIVLSPIREFWNKRLYRKVNNNLQNINPLGSVDKFDIYVSNEGNPELDFESKSMGIKRENYDYKITASYDGKNKVSILLDRNEIDIDVKSISLSYSNTDIETYDLSEFWNSDSFKKEKYNRKDFNREVKFEYSLKELLPKKTEEDLTDFCKIGDFKMNIYYLKSIRSKVEIIKDFKVRERKRLINNFSGVKIYRDNFKVRPYGDEGTYYDWINLSERVQKSPAAASHETGNWRVSPNQVIGSVSISRLKNKELEDTANREGMSLNEPYYLFIELIRGIFEKFEFDRQYPLRAYSLWLNEKKKKHKDKAQEIYERVMREKEKEKRNKTNRKDESSQEYSEEDYKDAIYIIGKEAKQEMTTRQLLMILSSAGVMAQTFSHEISRIASNLGSRGQQLRATIDYLLDNKEYEGDEDFNPYIVIDELDNTDLLLSDWVNLIMNSVEKKNFMVKEVELSSFLMKLKSRWDPLLAKKFIKFEIKCDIENIILKVEEADLYLIFNNFLLNSSYFLEEALGDRKIKIEVVKKDGHLYINMQNNGPKLNERFVQNPDEILNAGVTSKGYLDKETTGTGLGLWIAREAVERNYGQLHVILEESGFMLQASWKE